MKNRILKVWRKFSKIGTTDAMQHAERKYIMLSNQIALFIGSFALFGLILNTWMGGTLMSLGLVGVLLLTFATPILNKLSYPFISRILLSVLPTLFYFLPILLTGQVKAPSFLIFPFILVGFSLVPLILIDYYRQSAYWWLVVVFSFLINAGFDQIIFWRVGNVPGIDFLLENYVWYRIPHIFLWLGVVIAFIIMKSINKYYEVRLEVSNSNLKEKNNQLQTVEEELRQNIEELQTTREAVDRQNKKLSRLYKKLQADEKFLLKEYKKVKDRDIKIKQQNQELQQKNEELQITLEKLKEAQTQLVQSEKMVSLGVLTAGIAHEINNPVNYINSGVAGLERAISKILALLEKYEQLTLENFDEQKDEIETYKQKNRFDYLLETALKVIKNIGTGAQKTTEIVKGLRTFSRLDEADLKTVDIHEGIESVLVLLHNQYKNRVKIIKEYETIPPIECYPGKLNQVFMNLLSNAIQAIEGKGEILIKTSQITDNVRIVVKDSGKGIPQEIIDRIFEPFFTTKSVGQGTGLGLSISLSIIQQNHHGDIRVTSEPGKGSTFVITLPISQKHFLKKHATVRA